MGVANQRQGHTPCRCAARGTVLAQVMPPAQEDEDGSFVTRVRMMSADIKYGCEYLGNSGRLVVRI